MTIAAQTTTDRTNGKPPPGKPKTEHIAAHIFDALLAINPDPDVFELTVLMKGRGRDYTQKGYFNDRAALALAAAQHTLKPGSKAIYVNLQDIKPECLHRAHNKMLDGVPAVTAADVTRYRNFLIDGDRDGVKGISATEEERAKIRETILAIREFLVHELDWPDPRFEADSGNGYHDDWRLDLPATKENQDLIARCYKALNQKFGSDVLSIDASLADPNQLIKLYGTKCRKGDDTPERPHRFSKLLNTYETEPVTLEQLQALAALYVEPATDKKTGKQRTYWKAGAPEAVEAWAEGHGLTLGPRTADSHPQTGNGHKWRVDCLTCDGVHTDGAAIILNGSGYLKYRCHHNSCADKSEADALAKYPPPAARRKAQPSLSLDEILAKIAALGADTTLDDNARLQRLVDEIAGPVEQLDKAHHIAVELALVEHLKLSQKKAERFTAACRQRAKQAAKQTKADARQARQAKRPVSEKPAIDLADRQLSGVVADALAALVQRNERTPAEPLVYVRGGALTRIVRDESGAPGTQILSAGAVLHTLAEVADWVKISVDDDGNEFIKSEFPPLDVVRSVAAMGEWPGLPPLEGVVNAPTFAPDGTLHDKPGYNPVTRLFNASGLKLGNTTPAPEAIKWAKTLILEDLLGNFPFKDEASKAHAVGLLLLPFVRPMIDGPTPLHLIDSPTPGTGKGLLTSACALPATGRDVHSMAPGKDEDEWRKRLTSTLLLGGTHISIDNIREPLDSGVLASVLTQEYIEDRVLGSSQTVRLRVRTIWCANGNNITPSDEIARRSIWIRLDANTERPWERDGFKHQNLRTWALANRGQLVTAAVTLVRAWMAAGRPVWSGKNKGSYDAWSQVIGGILQTVEIPGFLANEAELFDTTVSDAEVLREFVAAWWNQYADSPVTSGELFKLASYPDHKPDDPLQAAQQTAEWHGLLDGVLGNGNQRSRQTRLGKLLGTSKDKVFGEYKIQKLSPSAGNPRWSLVNVGGERADQRSPHSQPAVPVVDDDYAKDMVNVGERYSPLDTRHARISPPTNHTEGENNNSTHATTAERSPTFTNTPVERSPHVHHHHDESEVVTWTL
ncbi:MAG: hypothetical protein DCC55_27975 [Chloroflexi bacterium]|nr:MAG: hypothetical protein DCC55_27975 [Chloroflexota bacterium]